MPTFPVQQIEPELEDNNNFDEPEFEEELQDSPVLDEAAEEGQENQTEEDSEEKPIKPRLSADVEFFLRDPVKGITRPVGGLINRSKGNPLWLDKYTGILEDNIALELNMPPAPHDVGFGQNCKNAYRTLTKWLREKNLDFTYDPSISITQEMLQEYPSLSEIGCSEDYVAYNEVPQAPRQKVTLDKLGLERHAAGHLHLSYDTKLMPPEIMAQWLDIFVGLPSVFWDKQLGRRKIYGLAGLYRPTKYPDGSSGVEYRTLSNRWFFDTKVQQRISGTIFWAINAMKKDPDEARNIFQQIPWKDIQDAINNEDEEEARTVLSFLTKRHPLIHEVHSMFGQIYGG